ncbi:hypothetical protein ACHZ97_13305 [Lysobacter soli]|uniref:hypothetical protein n=1 Tax=Lysobacter soli TaxID=453783 RepID=UPI0037C9BE99
MSAATETRQIISVARGTQDTDAVNVSQLKGVTTALGGGAAVNTDGTVKQPSYTINGTTYNDVGSALTAAAASGGSGDALNWNATTGAYDATHNGGTTPNKIVNVANGTNANDAVNFSQLKASEQSVATALGGGSTVNTDGTVTKPSYDVNGTKYDNVGGAVDALDTRIDGVNSTVTNITNGGGIKYFHTNSTAADSSASGSESVAIGGGAKAVGAASIAMGNNAQNVTGSNNSIAIGGDLQRDQR